jgi:uncharacterized membrane protein (UPF0127 family)
MDFHLIKLGETTFLVEECKDFSKGLSKREHLLENEGMLFNFNTPGTRSFHMKDCYVPLDIIFIEEGKIKKIFHNCPPCKNNDECKKYECDSADLVIEVLGGTCQANRISEGLIYRHF